MRPAAKIVPMRPRPRRLRQVRRSRPRRPHRRLRPRYARADPEPDHDRHADAGAPIDASPRSTGSVSRCPGRECHGGGSRSGGPCPRADRADASSDSQHDGRGRRLRHPSRPRGEAGAETAPPPPTSSSAGAPPAPDLASPSRVVLRANEDCWIEIRDTAAPSWASRLMHKGDAFPVPPRQGLSLTVGNAGALTVLLDGSPTPALGKTGMVRHDVSLDPDRVGKASIVANPAPAPSNGDSPNN